MTSTPANAKAAALEALIEAHAVELKLPTVRRRFRPLAAEAVREQQTPVAYLAALLEAETAERAERRERRRLIDARFPQVKRLEDFCFDDNPRVPQTTIATLAQGAWIDDRESVILISPRAHARICSIASRGRASEGCADSNRGRTCSAHAAAHKARSWWSGSVSVPPRRMVMKRGSRTLGRIMVSGSRDVA